jgi:hypothetical protein
MDPFVFNAPANRNSGGGGAHWSDVASDIDSDGEGKGDVNGVVWETVCKNNEGTQKREKNTVMSANKQST